MPKTLPSEQEPGPIDDLSLHAQIGRHMLRALGTPKDLLKIQVRPVGSNRFRVNVLTGRDFATGRIAHSFFLTTDEAGNIENSSPKINKLH